MAHLPATRLLRSGAGRRLGRRLRAFGRVFSLGLVSLLVQPVPSVAGHAQTGQRAERPALPDPVLPAGGLWGMPEPLIRDRLLQGRVVRAKKGRGGRSLGFKLYFEDGTKAYFKPDQAFSGTNWFAEVAAYHLDRALGLGRVPPVVAHRMPWAPLLAVAGHDRRIDEINVAEDGTVTGALVYWLPQALAPAVTPPGWENWLRVTPFVRWSVTPYQRPAAYAAALSDRKQRARRKEPAARYFDEAPAVTDAALPPALSDMLLLDFLTLNIDRWGGDNANVLVYGDADPSLIFLDNAAGFSPGPDRRGLMDDRLAVQECFRRATVARLRALELTELRARLATEAHGPILSEDLLKGIEVRRKAVLEYIDDLIQQHGEQAVLPWP